MRVKLAHKNSLNDLISNFINKNANDPENNHPHLQLFTPALTKRPFPSTHHKVSNKNPTSRSNSLLQQPKRKPSLPTNSLLSPSLNAWLAQLHPPLSSRLFAEDDLESMMSTERNRFARKTPLEGEFEAYGKARLKLRQVRRQKMNENHSQNKERIKNLFEQPSPVAKEHPLSKTNYDFKSVPRQGKAFRVNNKLVVLSPEKDKSMTITGLRFYQTLYK